VVQQQQPFIDRYSWHCCPLMVCKTTAGISDHFMQKFNHFDNHDISMTPVMYFVFTLVKTFRYCIKQEYCGYDQLVQFCSVHR